MTPDKVEAALGVLKGIKVRWNSLGECEEYQKSLSVLTEALAESRRDAARYRWAVLSYAEVDSQLADEAFDALIGPHSKEYVDAKIDAAMKETP